MSARYAYAAFARTAGDDTGTIHFHTHTQAYTGTHTHAHIYLLALSVTHAKRCHIKIF